MQQIHCPGTCSCSHSCGLYSKGRQRQLNNSNRTKPPIYIVHLPALIWCILTVSDVVEACATTLNQMGTLLSKRSTFVSDEDSPGQNDSLQFTTLLHDCSTTSSFRLTALPLYAFLPSIWHIAFSSFQTCTLYTAITHMIIYIYIIL